MSLKLISWFLVAAVSLMVVVSSRAAEDDQAQDNSSLVTFVPVREKTRELVIVELVRPDGRNKNYAALEKTILSSGWRAERNGDFFDIPGKCTIEVLADGQYAVDCWLIHLEGRDVLRQEVKTSEEAVSTIKTFSRLRTYRQPPKKVRPLRTILV